MCDFLMAGSIYKWSDLRQKRYFGGGISPRCITTEEMIRPSETPARMRGPVVRRFCYLQEQFGHIKESSQAGSPP